MPVPASTPVRGSGGWSSTRPIGVSIGAVVGLLVLVVLATNLLAVLRISEMRAGQELIHEENLEPLGWLAEVQRQHAAYRGRALEYAVSGPERRRQLIGETDEASAALEAGLAAYEPSIVAPEAMAEFAVSRARYVDLVATQLVPAAAAGDIGTFSRVHPEVLQPLLQIMDDGLEIEGVAQSDRAAARNTEAADEAGTAISELVATAVASVALAGVLTLLPVRRLTRTVRSGRRTAEADAAGDVTVVTHVRSTDELGRTAALDAVQADLRSVVRAVASPADAVAASSEELSPSWSQISPPHGRRATGPVSSPAPRRRSPAAWPPWPPGRSGWGVDPGDRVRRTEAGAVRRSRRLPRSWHRSPIGRPRSPVRSRSRRRRRAR